MQNLNITTVLFFCNPLESTEELYIKLKMGFTEIFDGQSSLNPLPPDLNNELNNNAVTAQLSSKDSMFICSLTRSSVSLVMNMNLKSSNYSRDKLDKFNKILIDAISLIYDYRKLSRIGIVSDLLEVKANAAKYITDKYYKKDNLRGIAEFNIRYNQRELFSSVYVNNITEIVNVGMITNSNVEGILVKKDINNVINLDLNKNFFSEFLDKYYVQIYPETVQSEIK